MIVIVDEEIIFTEDKKVMLILHDIDKKNIASMPPDASMYAMFSDKHDKKHIEDWMSRKGKDVDALIKKKENN